MMLFVVDLCVLVAFSFFSGGGVVVGRRRAAKFGFIKQIIKDVHTLKMVVWPKAW